MLMDLYCGHGGNIVERNLVVVGGKADDAQAMARCFQQAGDKAKPRP